MELKDNRLIISTNWLYITIISCFLVLPLAQKNLNFIKRKSLVNVAVDYTYPLDLNKLKKNPLRYFKRFVWPRLVDGSFQLRFNTWFMQTHGLWGYLVTTHNQIAYQFFRQIASLYGSNTSFMVGKDYSLFQTLYLRDYNGDIKYKHKILKRLVRRIKMLQNYMHARSKTVIVLVSANKLILHPEFVPARFRRPESSRGQRMIDDFIELAEFKQVNLLYTTPLLEKLKTTVDYPLFAKPAAHWNSPAACHVSAALMHKIADLLRYPVNTISCPSTVKFERRPLGADFDLANVINVWDPSLSFEPTPYVKPNLVPAKNARPLNMLFIGTSFLWSIFDVLEPIRSYPVRDFYYYGNTNNFSRIPMEGKPVRGKERVDYAKLDWDKEVFDKDVIVLEVNEARLNNIGFQFINHVTNVIKQRKGVRKLNKKNTPL